MERRQFLAAAAVAAGGAKAADRLALEGGPPVRATPLHARYFGPLYYDEKERAELVDVLETGRPFRWYGPGNQPPVKVSTFEQEFARRMQTRFALAVTSGTAALQCAVAALGIGPGDEVILPAWTWHSCFNAIVLAGALPVHVLVPGESAEFLQVLSSTVRTVPTRQWNSILTRGIMRPMPFTLGWR